MSDDRIKRRKLEPVSKPSLVASPLVRQGGALLDQPEKGKSPDSSVGKTLIPNIDQSSWSPLMSAKKTDDGALTLELQNFNTRTAQNGSGNNTVGK